MGNRKDGTGTRSQRRVRKPEQSKEIEEDFQTERKWDKKSVPCSPKVPRNTTNFLRKHPAPSQPTTPQKWLVWRRKIQMTPQQEDSGFDIEERQAWAE